MKTDSAVYIPVIEEKDLTSEQLAERDAFRASAHELKFAGMATCTHEQALRLRERQVEKFGHALSGPGVDHDD